MKKFLSHLKNIGPWVLGVVGSFIVWLKFVHDPKVAKEAKAKLKLKELDKRRENLEEVEADTRISEMKLEEKKRKLEEDLNEKTQNRSASDAADRMAERFGWTTDRAG